MSTTCLEARLLTLVADCPLRMRALRHAAAVMADAGIGDWYLAAGAIRNLVWDQLHGFVSPVPADLDLIYFNTPGGDIELELQLQQRLLQLSPDLPWSVKDQGWMHLKSGDAPYHSTFEAMGRWPEQETAIGVRLEAGGLQLAVPFGLESLFALRLSPNPARPLALFYSRLQAKRWLEHYPLLRALSVAAD
ncbi:nucleotidyltransferase family protein [Shewanella cyperi]|uniref:Nucleotidyltransferase family protein n=1 Tax=Shewanella cyperi TaxID=2814292 RepID=A0A974XVP7_9GAMM|nr:nucleotidyltransferase family protein [Shewanella cyperi]QSX31134.1 nucleotidyltransferase family protein [Shewanella cyperi]